MCGILGWVSIENFSVRDLVSSLKRLEYRGYDSFGFATKDGTIQKFVGTIDSSINSVGSFKTDAAIAHTRWATHGKISKKNAHPHFSNNKKLFVVHNGIIENYTEIKKSLEETGYRFYSETDTEIIPAYFQEKLKEKEIKEAIYDFLKDIKGTFAILLLEKNKGELYAIKRDSPLVIGLCKDKYILASDIYAFSDLTNKAVFLEDNMFAEVTKNSCKFYRDNEEVIVKITEFEWAKEDKIGDYPHYMIKEIKEQPDSSFRLVQSLKTVQKNKIAKIAGLIKNKKRVVFVSCGTSYHASLIGASLLIKLGIEAHAVIASEFENFILIDENTLVIAISQSGETMDVISVLKKIHAPVVSITNVPYSTIQRMSDYNIDSLAGQEICVAATKSFTNQLIVLYTLAKELGYKIELDEIPNKIKATIEKSETKIKKLAKSLYKAHDIFVLGSGSGYPIAREIALKLKEIPYVHAEGMMAGELKHGTLALITKGVPVISLIPNNDTDMITSTKEVEARGAMVIVFSNGRLELPKSNLFATPACHNEEFAIYACILGHLLSYHLGVLRGCEIDKPRNLAKSVTVK